jgi:putative tryptophan/tyrosine transport system substrate-binding protein
MTTILLRRRGVLAAIALAFSQWRAEAQERVRRVAVLNGVIQHDEGEALVALFRETLANLGWRAGRNLELEVRWSTASAESTRRAAGELLRWKPDVILARNTISVEKLLELKTELPIVFVSVFDPFGSGFVTEVTRPGKNITGFTTHDYGMAVKWVEFLKLVAPQVTRVALLFNPETAPYAQRFFDNLFTKAAQQIGVEASAAMARSEVEIDNLIAEIGRSGGGLCVMADPFTSKYVSRIVEAVARERVPAVYPWSGLAKAGGLLSYSIVQDEMYRRAAEYVDRILRGERPGDLPVQSPTKYELLINLKTARELGISIPDHVLALADAVIE